ncbi:MurR/RpiR family transcriptional regulator [Candidatus Enterococcus mansonii]|uniref:Phosphosugar-binding transcriptional regulator n=1 Tax=Candidatus Enterococcus mansonii TaxID=1834181 RepID=A0A242CCJ0_9ENTE|nr:MurR/RpiR family transcriptional regulator [Enterococcus sp. 4G2_DIV0659]OTO07975.1 hypothetical protein A5880_002245 [Enterococcus sp. 4G2_DIV0659]
MLIIEKLNTKEDMTEAEIIIADFIIMIGKKISKSSTRSIAEATYTSAATVVRLCKKLGFSGFNDFRNHFLVELDYIDNQFGSISANFPFEKKDSYYKAANKIGSLYKETVDDTLSLLNDEILQKAVNLIKYSYAIHLFSYGTNLNIAETFREKMLKIGKPVYLSTNLNYQRYEARVIGKEDVAIIISYSGETANIIEIAQTCKQNNIPIILITSLGENTVSKYSACKLVISTKEHLFQNLGNFSTNISISLLLDVLYSTFFLTAYDLHYKNKLGIVGQLENKRKSSNSTINDWENDETVF